jgi:hypothetical protein
MEMLLSNSVDLTVGYSGKFSAENQISSFKGAKALNLDKEKIEEYVSKYKAKPLLILYDGVEVEEKYSRKCYLKKPDAIQVLSLFSLQSVEFARYDAWRSLGSFLLIEAWI